MPLKNGSEVYENWIKPPVTPRMMLYVFNVTNHEAFLAGREKPNLVELGHTCIDKKCSKPILVFPKTAKNSLILCIENFISNRPMI